MTYSSGNNPVNLETSISNIVDDILDEYEEENWTEREIIEEVSTSEQHPNFIESQTITESELEDPDIREVI